MNKNILKRALEETYEEVLLKDIPSKIPDTGFASNFKEKALKTKQKKKFFYYVAAILFVLIIPLGVKMVIDNLFSQRDSSIIVTYVASDTYEKIENRYGLELKEVSTIELEDYIKTIYNFNSKRVILKQYKRDKYNEKNLKNEEIVFEKADEYNKIIAIKDEYVFEISGKLTEKELIKLYNSLKLQK